MVEGRGSDSLSVNWLADVAAVEEGRHWQTLAFVGLSVERENCCWGDVAVSVVEVRPASGGEGVVGVKGRRTGHAFQAKDWGFYV